MIGSWIFYAAIISFCLGVALRHFFDFGWSFLIIVLLLVISVIPAKAGIQVLLIIATFFLGYFRLHIILENTQIYFLEKQTTYATVTNEPDQRENFTHYIVTFSESEDLKARITIGQYPILKYGDRIQITGTFEKPENFTNKNGISFDYINFLLKDDIQFVSYFPEVEKVLDPGSLDPLSGPGSFKKLLFDLKYWFVNGLEKALPAPHSALAAGILVGAKQALGKDLLEDFRRVGLIHIVVLSGYNVTIIIDAIQKALSFLPRSSSFVLSLFSIISFALFTGASATTVRASIMAALVVVARYMHRTYGVNRALFLAGFLMVLHNPKILLSDPGFQLSFVATLGLLHLSPKLELLLEKIKVPDRFEIRQIIAATISTQIAVLPLLISMTGEVSVVALLANLLVLPVIPLAMAFSALSGLAVHFLGYITLTFSVPTYFLLEYCLVITEWLAALSFAVIDIQFWVR